MRSLLRKHTKAIKGLEASQEDHEELTATVDEDTLEEWISQVKAALVNRQTDLSAMDIYEVRMEKG